MLAVAASAEIVIIVGAPGGGGQVRRGAAGRPGRTWRRTRARGQGARARAPPAPGSGSTLATPRLLDDSGGTSLCTVPVGTGAPAGRPLIGRMKQLGE